MAILEALFGCRHKKLSFPLTVRRRRQGPTMNSGTYTVCLDCGKEFVYDWNQMQIVSTQAEPRGSSRGLQYKATV